MNRFFPIMVVILLAACSQEQSATSTTTTQPEAAPPAAVTDNTSSSATPAEFTIDVSGTFSPSSVNVPAGQPVRLHFKRGEAPTCADEIVFPALGIRKKLPKNETVTVDLPPQPEGRLEFACGMDMIKGSVVVQRS